MEYLAFGFVTLKWWTYPIITGVVLGSVWLGFRLEELREKRQHRADGPYPCFAHLGTGPDGFEWWCRLKEGHDGPHRNELGEDPDSQSAIPLFRF